MYTNSNTINYLNNISANISKKIGIGEFPITETEFTNIHTKLMGPMQLLDTHKKTAVMREPIEPSPHYGNML